jgi:hypothetical protein
MIAVEPVSTTLIAIFQYQLNYIGLANYSSSFFYQMDLFLPYTIVFVCIVSG